MAKKISGKNSGGMMFLIVVLLLGLALGSYSNTKSMNYENLQSTQGETLGYSAPTSYANAPPRKPHGGSQNQSPPGCSKQDAIHDPSELLPVENKNEFSNMQPDGDLAKVNLLKAGYHIGIDTVGQTLRNANLQLRSEPANPQMNVCPWNQSTIEPDLVRRPLEIGCGPKVCGQ